MDAYKTGFFKHLLDVFNLHVFEKQQSLASCQAKWCWEKEIVDSINENHQNKILLLDVGGTVIHASQRTFTQAQASDSMLGVWLSGEWSWEIETEEDGLTLIDRDGDIFQRGGILDWLREGTDHIIFKSDKEQNNWWTRTLLHSAHRLKAYEWIRTLEREATYFGLCRLASWCEDTLHRSAPDFAVFTHCDSRSELSSDFEVGIFDEATRWVGLGRQCLIPAATGTVTFLLKVLSDSADGFAGFRCECGVQEAKPPSEEKRKPATFKTRPCAWNCYKARGWRALKGDVIGVHLGQPPGHIQSTWLTCNGHSLGPPTEIVDIHRWGPNDHLALVPYLNVYSGAVRVLWQQM
eukprot:TRINITY_DN53488_c1_g1_i1.p1 TRINITY_DN53488_c1_g1~~TRINITY_DN53488_c1_g1_i1.p1  ORF type:complete len:350 (+),score=19.41 TRINITY_DN53488_c1_g1_i1:31-1080(+)